MPYCCGGSHVLKKNARMRICQHVFLFYFLLPQHGIRVLYFERNKTFSVPATKEQSDFEFLRNSSSPPLDFVQCKTTHPLMKNLVSFLIRRMIQCLRIKPNVVPLPEAAGSLCLYGNKTEEVSGFFYLNFTQSLAFLPNQNSRDTDIESSSPLSRTDRQSVILSPNIMPIWSPSASDFLTCAASSSVSDFETSVTSPSASRILLSQTVCLKSFSFINKHRKYDS